MPLSQIAAQMQEEKTAAAEASPSGEARASTEAPRPKKSARAAEPSPAGAPEASATDFGDAAIGSVPGHALESSAPMDTASVGDAPADAAEEAPEDISGSDGSASSDPSENLTASKNAPRPESSDDPSSPGDSDAGVSADASGSAGDSAESPRPSRRLLPKLGKPKHPARWAFLAFVAILVSVCVLFSWERWWRYDDASSIQGQWTVEGGSVPVSIDGESIHLTDKESYGYAMDQSAKTLSFTFGDMSGQARYRFSADRTQLAIQDGEYGFWETLASDIAWSWSCLIATVTGQPQPSPSFGEGSIVLVDTAAATSQPEQPVDASADQDASQEEQSVDGQAAVDAEVQAEAEAQAAEDEQRQSELLIQEALDSSADSAGSVGSNAVTPDDLA